MGRHGMPFAPVGNMSKHNNVNPNFYKTGGREHAEGHGEAIPHDQEKKKMTELPGAKKSPQTEPQSSNPMPNAPSA